MTEIPAAPNPTAEEFVIQSAYEAAFLPEHERHEQREIVSELIGELATESAKEIDQREKLLNIFDKNMRIARGESDTPEDKTAPVSVDVSKIDWLEGEGQKDMTANVIETDHLTYKFVDLTQSNNAIARATDKLKAERTPTGENVHTKLIKNLQSTGLPKLYLDIKTGNNLRPRTRGGGKSGRERAATDFPAYKIDVQGTNNRAIVLLLEDGSEGPVIGLAALYDHEDDLLVHKAIQ